MPATWRGLIERDLSRRHPMQLAPVAAVENLEPAGTLTLYNLSLLKILSESEFGRQRRLLSN
jgi:hypothetical protein